MRLSLTEQLQRKAQWVNQETVRMIYKSAVIQARVEATAVPEYPKPREYGPRRVPVSKPFPCKDY